MNQNTLKGNWAQIKSAVQNQWSLLTDDDIRRIAGKYNSLVAKLQDRYGYTEQEAKRKIHNFSDYTGIQLKKANIKRIAQRLNNQAKRSPWTLAAITTVGGLFIGLMLRNRIHKNKFSHFFRK